MNKIKKIIRTVVLLALALSLLTGFSVTAAAEEISFTDVTDSDWAKEYILRVSDEGIMNGTGGGKFSPRTPVTRAMVVTVLYRLEEAPEVKEGYSFEDVPAEQYYTVAVKWASDNGIVNGTHTGTLGEPYFSPDRNISREELATMLLRYARFKCVNVILEEDITLFRDAEDVSSWAEEGVRWAVHTGLINGTGDGGTLSPAGEATREQFAAIICRFKDADLLFMPAHLFYDRRRRGKSVELTGDVHVICIYVSDGESEWTEEEIADTFQEQKNALEALEAQAEKYGAGLDITLGYYEYTTDEVLMRSAYLRWADTVLKGLGFDSMNQVNDKLREMLCCDETAVVFCFDKEERSFAMSANYNEGSEFAVVYGKTADALPHELCHLFGAYDYYFPNVVEEAAKKYLAGSVMLGGYNSTVDSLTAYLIGWTDEVYPEALAFLSETSGLTKAEYDEEHRDETYTGYVEDRVGDGYVYTGQLKDGVIHGKGKIIFDSGTTYDGEWDNGRMHGEGTITWADGTQYTGEFVYNEMTGQGEMHYTSGDVYVGAFVDGVREGYGEYVWYNGDSYAGEWSEGKRHGYGVYTKANGQTVVGNWINDMYAGKK
ncbi:MAG: S-layer homology domain-containing protein [Clostridia bacterium]|nr:S-layer homology domain-containing protein [Clostridia bacterium]